LARPRGLTGLAGREEAEAFVALTAVPAKVTDELIAETRDHLVPPPRPDFAAFAGLYRYGRLSGECFAARQGGPYNGPVLAGLVEQLRSRGYQGVGQSSWGPTIFVALPSDAAAVALIRELERRRGDELETMISAPANQGARIAVAGGRKVEQDGSA
jgi:predicted sugar kinase